MSIQNRVDYQQHMNNAVCDLLITARHLEDKRRELRERSDDEARMALEIARECDQLLRRVFGLESTPACDGQVAAMREGAR